MGGIKSKRHSFSLLFTILSISSRISTSTGSSVDGSELAKQRWLFDYSFRPDLFHEGTWKQTPCHPREPLKVLHSQPMNEIPNVLVDLDVSSCCLGDTGILQVVQSFLDEILPPLQPAALQSSTVRGITLRFNMNRLTPHGATKLIQLLIHQQQASYQRYCIQNLQNTTTIQTNQSSSFISLHNDTIPTTTTNWTFYIHELDLGFNDLGGYHHHHHQSQQEEDTLDNKSWRSSSSSHSFLKSIRHLLEDEQGTGLCPTIVRLDTCGLGPQACRFIGKGIVHGASLKLQRIQNKTLLDPSILHSSRPLQLSLSGNEAIGDAGLAAIAAALKTSPRISLAQPVIHTLDLSSCGIGDTGVEALANAIECNPGCVHVLDLSNNKITDEGAITLGRALQQSYENIRTAANEESQPTVYRGMDHINLSNNRHIGDRGLSELSLAMECEALRRLSLRSCSVQAEGVAAVGKMFSFLASKRLRTFGPSWTQVIPIEVDLSGNSFGSLQEKDKKGGIASYSASLLKSKASATTASYLNFIGKKIKSGLKDAGLDLEGLLPSEDQSDQDEEEGDQGLDEQDAVDGSAETDEVEWEKEAFDIASKYSAAKCGARAFADAVLDSSDYKEELSDESVQKSCAHQFQLGMRFCSLDSSALDALAAVKLYLQDRHHAHLNFDVGMNRNIDSNTLSVMRGVHSSIDASSLKEMSQRYMDARETMRKARERAMQATEAESARLRSENAMSGMIEDNDEEEDGDDDLYDDEADDFR